MGVEQGIVDTPGKSGAHEIERVTHSMKGVRGSPDECFVEQ